ncbi:CidA/LrgA family protein [Polaromonas sp. CG_9.11]|uniref:CidA/LrgA family protein n=1 Tax=Polaromonas sp. CG_9.11 TaxID=2787730 RepID=UPI0018C98A70|nr:CidA/LrgA family protein [Polaromonas sp. CG_9.11]MBG6076918.1 holin-like protein [Polaromonas sp. CG_9.11]
MNALRGMMWLLVFQSAGELLGRGLALPLPGPVIGMVLLLLALHWPVVQEPVAACAEFLLSHLSLLFVPVGVGVMTHLSLVSEYGIRMLAVVVLSTAAGLAVTVLTLHLLRDRHPVLAAATTPAKDGDV